MANMTRIERRILSNQYSILEILDPNHAGSYAKRREIVENGFEGEYDDVLRDIYDTSDVMTVDDCEYVGDVFQMYDMMQTAYKKGQSEGVDPARLKFPGFDGNNETKFVSYAQFLTSTGKWTFLDVAPSDFNSHFPTAAKYSQMLDEWRASKDKLDLTAADIVRILG